MLSKPATVTVPPPAPLKVPPALIDILLFKIPLGALVRSVLTAPKPVAVTLLFNHPASGVI